MVQWRNIQPLRRGGDTAASLGKEVNFEIVGGDAELDKSMVEKIADPLMHLVRNSLDHGLEPPQERLAAGKPAAGKLVLSARHETGAILIRIEDDGRGINRDRVLQRAWNRGLLEQGLVPSDDVINMMIFEPRRQMVWTWYGAISKPCAAPSVC
jgi:two-component system chemotaxis sensor kinase CheA